MADDPWKSFDYVIVGGGSAGCVLANRLSEDPSNSVCLLEAGPPDRSPFIHVPLGLLRGMSDPKINWLFFSEPQAHAKNRPIFLPRGKTLGGSSAINGMVYIRGNRGDYDEWAELGNPGWAWRDVLPYFKKSENNEHFDGELHGTGGELNVKYLETPNPLNELWTSAAERLQYKRSADFNGETQEGFGTYQVTQKNGRRASTAVAFLKPVRRRKNLEVITDAAVARVLLDGGRAAGVELIDGGRRIDARKEVILSAGALVSPKILLQSGIGPAGELSKIGIGVLHDLPGVGKNLQDHISAAAHYRTRSRLGYGLSAASLPFLAWSGIQYFLRRRGLLASNMVEAGGFWKSGPAAVRPDIQFIFVPGYREPPPRMVGYGHGYLANAVLLRPESRGEVTVAGNDPSKPPVVQPRFFSEGRDLEVLFKGFQEARRIVTSETFRHLAPEEFLPRPTVTTDDDVRDYIRGHAGTIFHPVGTCRMGTDDGSVVDPELRVKGIGGLRVVDASIMPRIVGGNTNAPTIMIAEKAADMILGKPPLGA